MSAKVNLKPYRQALEALLSHQTTAKMSTLLGSAAANLDDPWLRGQLKTIINNIRVDSDRRSEARRLIRMLPHTFESEQLNELIEYIEDVIDANESAWEILASRYGWESPGESTGEKMPKVVVDGVEYVPKAEIEPIADDRLQACLEVLTEMRYFNQHHKMKALAWNAINALSPDLAALDEDAAYERIHGTEED